MINRKSFGLLLLLCLLVTSIISLDRWLWLKAQKIQSHLAEITPRERTFAAQYQTSLDEIFSHKDCFSNTQPQFGCSDKHYEQAIADVRSQLIFDDRHTLSLLRLDSDQENEEIVVLYLTGNGPGRWGTDTQYVETIGPVRALLNGEIERPFFWANEFSLMEGEKFVFPYQSKGKTVGGIVVTRL